MDIYCALCGEPWGCSGLNYTTSDLDLHDWYNVINGYGCPCCPENGFRRGDEPRPEYLEQWRRSVAKASEGTVETFELGPAQCEVFRELLAGGMNRISAAIECAEPKYMLVSHAQLGGGDA